MGDTIAATINGELVASVRDGTYQRGRMELGVFAPSLTIDARWDNLFVYRRSPSPSAATP